MTNLLEKHAWWIGGAIILLLFILHEINKAINIPFLYVILACSIIAFILLFIFKKMNYKIALLFVFLLGLLVRLFIMYRIDPLSNYQHDIFWGGFGHWDYIKYVAEHLNLPPNYNGEAFQPPVHYIIMGVFYRIAAVFKLDIPYFVQCVVLYMNFLLFIVMRKLIMLNAKKEASLFWGMIIFIMFPTNIIYALSLNNDPTFLFFSVISLYYFLLWFKHKTYKNIALLGVFSSLTFLSKATGAVIPVTVLIIAVIYAMANWREIKTTLKHAGVYIVSFVPLTLLYFIRLIHIKQSLFYNPETSSSLGNTLKDFIGFAAIGLIKNPMAGNSLFEYLYKTSMFDEYGQYMHNYVLPLAKFLSTLGLIVMAIWVVLFIINIIKERGIVKTYILPVFYFVTMAVMFVYRYDHPNLWNEHFRYILPVIAVYGIGISWGYDKINNKYIRFGLNIIFVLFAVSSFAYYSILS